ncbi:helix-turn-helix domain-containing protein [Streptomyces mobaraensis NBRC 13819 = DSM 40847]|uniref:Helix-turn-helix domain-containing protein n=2 Tax=Streptomyces mobaraensis TaxID=35621 RepID=A0A5N5WEU6_STRMB|nr:helix-turn-helix transcriptional regulator [Streptomyces mobaraensis]KAB7850265.1 helix-turn-helix domain-containing protein [Streptomyces mobaraensis]QTT73719.1 helix-turn-helix domain-containing protein [Streptomyces mobaraensis NBRC 13819 = DSM 40847]
MTTMVQESPAAALVARGDGTGSRGIDDAARRAELAAFLRSRRERITPEQVGLPRGSRRRTPGLRREEVALRAAVGVTWYTWLEQGRDIQVSAQVLDAIARALLLDRAERAHLFALANASDPAPNAEPVGVPAGLRLMLEQLEPFPACVQNARYDILAYNRTYKQLICDLDALPPEERNCLWLHFTNETWYADALDREDAKRAMAAKFRAAMADHLAEPAWKCLLKRLRDASPEFREVWERHEVIPPAANRQRVFRQARVGLLNLDHTNLWTGPHPGTRLLVFTPADEETHARLRRLLELVRAEEG